MSIIITGVTVCLKDSRESEMITKKMERHSMTKENERLKQMGKDIHQVEYDGYNNTKQYESQIF